MLEAVSFALRGLKEKISSALESQQQQQPEFHWILYLGTESMIVNPDAIYDIIKQYSSSSSTSTSDIDPATTASEKVRVYLGPDFYSGSAMLMKIPTVAFTKLIIKKKNKSSSSSEKYLHPFFPFITSSLLSSSSSTSNNNNNKNVISEILLNGLHPAMSDVQGQIRSSCLLRVTIDSNTMSEEATNAESEPKLLLSCLRYLNSNYRTTISSSSSALSFIENEDIVDFAFVLDVKKFSGVFQPLPVTSSSENNNNNNNERVLDPRSELAHDPHFKYDPTRAIASFSYCHLGFASIDACAVRLRVARDVFARNARISTSEESMREPESFLDLLARAHKQQRELQKLIDAVKQQRDKDDFEEKLKKFKNSQNNKNGNPSGIDTSSGADGDDENTHHDNNNTSKSSNNSTHDHLNEPRGPLTEKDLLFGAKHHFGGPTTQYKNPELIAPDVQHEIGNTNNHEEPIPPPPPPTTTETEEPETTTIRQTEEDLANNPPQTLGPQQFYTDSTNRRNKKLRIAILTFAAFNPVAIKRSFNEELTVLFHKLGWANKKAYCDRWQYDYILENATELMKGDPRPLAFGKIKAMMKFLPLYDWVMWMDTDSLIMNYNITIESILHFAWNEGTVKMLPKKAEEAELRKKKRDNLRAGIKADYAADEKKKEQMLANLEAAFAREDKMLGDGEPNSGYSSYGAQKKYYTGGDESNGDNNLIDFIIAKDWNGINSGIFFLRNSDWSMKFLKRINRGLSPNVCTLPKDWWEQRVMMCLLDPKKSTTWSRDKHHVLYIDTQRMFNSYGYPTNENSITALYRKGDFIAHFPNCKSFKTCTFNFKQHWKDQFEVNKEFYPKSFISDYRSGAYANNYPRTVYPKRYWDYLKKSTRGEGDNFNYPPLYLGGPVDETDLSDDYDGQYGYDNRGNEIQEVHRRVRRPRHITGDIPTTTTISALKGDTIDSYRTPRKRQTGKRSELLDQLDRQKNFTLPPRISRREKERQQKKLKLEEEERRKKKLLENKEMGVDDDNKHPDVKIEDDNNNNNNKVEHIVGDVHGNVVEEV